MNKQSGFSLVEVIIAAGLTILIVGGGTYLYINFKPATESIPPENIQIEEQPMAPDDEEKQSATIDDSEELGTEEIDNESDNENEAENIQEDTEKFKGPDKIREPKGTGPPSA